jgi:RNA polymerase sigma factor (sigma-70 family)
VQKIEEMYVEYSKQVYKYLFCLTHNEHLAEELTQETFYIALKKTHSFRGECKLYVWLCQIAKHLYYKELKKHKRLETIPLQEMQNRQVAREDGMENNCISQLDMYQKMERLEEKEREVMYLRIMADLSFKQIGELLNISENLARVTFYRAKLKIKEDEENEKK